MSATDIRRVNDLQEGETFIVLRHLDNTVHWASGVAWLRDPSITRELATVFLMRPLGLDEIDPEHPARDHHLRIGTKGANKDERWSLDVPGTAFVTVVGPRHEVCAECGRLWPCPDEIAERMARELARHLDDLCHHCGKEIGSAWKIMANENGERVRFHLAKKYRGPDGRRCIDVARARGLAGAP